MQNFSRILFLFLLLLPSRQIVAADWLSGISDNALRTCIEKSLAEESSSASSVTRLKCHSKGVRDLTGIKQLSNLTWLSLFNNKLTQADLTELTKLTFLNVAKNQLTELNVAGLSELETLFAFQNSLVSVDLNGLPALRKLRLMQNNLKALEIKDLVALESAHLFDNQLAHLGIEGLSNLSFLDVKQNPMPDELYDFFDEQVGIVISHDGNADDWK